jgi:hypothetical protein
MIEFTIPQGTEPGFTVFDLGNLRNPSFAQLLTGFVIKIQDATLETIAQSNEQLVFVNIRAGFLT